MWKQYSFHFSLAYYRNKRNKMWAIYVRFLLSMCIGFGKIPKREIIGVTVYDSVSKWCNSSSPYDSVWESVRYCTKSETPDRRHNWEIKWGKRDLCHRVPTQPWNVSAVWMNRQVSVSGYMNISILVALPLYSSWILPYMNRYSNASCCRTNIQSIH